MAQDVVWGWGGGLFNGAGELEMDKEWIELDTDRWR